MTFAETARIVARVYAGFVLLAGIGLLGIAGLLIGSFGADAGGQALFLYLVLPGIAYAVLSVFVWRQQGWAIVAALGLAVALLILVGRPSPLTGVILVGTPIAFTVLTLLYMAADAKAKP